MEGVGEVDELLELLAGARGSTDAVINRAEEEVGDSPGVIAEDGLFHKPYKEASIAQAHVGANGHPFCWTDFKPDLATQAWASMRPCGPSTAFNEECRRACQEQHQAYLKLSKVIEDVINSAIRQHSQSNNQRTQLLTSLKPWFKLGQELNSRGQ
eukprot:g31493.t1